MLSLICAHAATDSDSSSMCTTITFPVLMLHIHFRFFLTLLVTFEVSCHKCGWYNSTKVYHPKLHQLCKQFNQFFFWEQFPLSGAHVCRVTFKHLPQPLQSHILSFGILGQLFKIPPFSAHKLHSAGVGGSPNFFGGWHPIICVT
jgi:hypothetical protein